MRRWLWLWPALLMAVTSLAAAAPAAPLPLTAYFGAYVGRAVEEDGSGQLRDIDIVISPYKDTGFEIQWTNVTLVDGRRDVPGVRRRPGGSVFVPGRKDGLFVESPGFNPFQLKDEVAPLKGDAIRWASLDERGLHVYAFVVLDDGRYEMQTYTRRLTDTGLDLTFERVVDGKVLRRMSGRAVRAE